MVVTFLESNDTTISAQTTVRASAHEIYALVANPTRHHELDGGGNVQNLRNGAEGTANVGDTFTQNMKLGIPYIMTSKVIRADENRGITWQLPTDHTWAWDIEENTDGTCTVTETFDATHARLGPVPLAPVFRAFGSFSRNRKSIALSLAQLQRTFA
ncbi:SRPBCC family protein [Rothia terrae]|uniref:SRPBCC family protein n=1 Tax=Rothia terrae TaxID=396015 RepID=UPI0033EB969A